MNDNEKPIVTVTRFDRYGYIIPEYDRTTIMRDEAPSCPKCEKTMKEQDELQLSIRYPQFRWICNDCGIGMIA